MSMRSHIDIVTKALTEAAVPAISPQEARTRKLFGPVYHGSDSIEEILAQGFDMNRAENGRANGYPFQPYSPGGGLPAPVHHLGFGAYFTTVKSIAKSFNGGSEKGLREFWLDVPNVKEINFGSSSTMMRWWYQNGYRPSDDILARRDYREWTEQTRALTDTLSSQFDAVWFKGKGIRKLLDGDQICVYDPAKIFVVDPKLATGIEVGAKVVHNQKHLHWAGRNDVYIDTIDHDTRFVGWTAYFKVFDHNNNEVPKDQAFQLHRMPPAGMVGTIVGVRACPPAYNGGRTEKFDVKWAKGGVMHGYFADELAPAPVATRKTAAKKVA